MLELFLSEPTWADGNGSDESSAWRKSRLDELEIVIWSLMSSDGRSEARLWLCNTLSSIRSISHRCQRELFVSLLRSMPVKQYLASQLLQLIFEKWPQKVGPIIAKRSKKLENFFKGNPRRILQWFSNFSESGYSEHGKGAKALSRFAFVNRDICWEELEWKGKHGQSPAMVATKPHYFLDLDVQRTVENFLEYVPEFWSSQEFSESLKDGEILLIDTRFFIDMFIDLMYNKELGEVWKVVEDFLMEESFSFLCSHLLIILEEQDLHLFLDLIPKYMEPRSGFLGFRNASEWFEIILSKYSASISIDQLLLLNAVTTQGRRLLRLVQEEGSKGDMVKIKNLVSQLCNPPSHGHDFVLLMEEGFKKKPLELIKWLGVQSWALHFRLLEEFHSPETWESLFISNGIGFRESDKYAILHDEFVEDYGSDRNERSSIGLKSKKGRKKRRKRRRDHDPAENYENEKLDVNLSSNMLAMPSKAGDWLLSIDDYSTTWSSVSSELIFHKIRLNFFSLYTMVYIAMTFYCS
ncbi:uncharacterized protein LOC142549658 isoform X1 [Primulina tabacum]|uniref:uncharacterized protein LOC142549658 isoform X1 n=1 Tax=Primulina tabacum TaxID=48773 RepID=UPI003F59878F